VTGVFEFDGVVHRLEDIIGSYIRPMDDRLLPELADEPAASPRRVRCRGIHEAFARWCEISPGRVVNRASAQASNSSKPYQAQLIRAQGIDVPDTLITNDPDAVQEFRRHHGRIIYKSISGVRSVVRLLGDEDMDRIDRIRWCPVQFQEFVDGVNVRVHVVGDRVFPTRIVSDATDYRYARDQVGQPAELHAFELDHALAERCVSLAEGLGLAFAGIDLKITPEGRVVCFEVNPSPGFSYYEANTGQPIAAAVAAYLAHR
jgi:glutathione synthase/RimK-type ligase-like ATP-grasp enzyme